MPKEFARKRVSGMVQLLPIVVVAVLTFILINLLTKDVKISLAPETKGAVLGVFDFLR